MKRKRKRLPGLIKSAKSDDQAALLALYGEHPPTGEIFEVMQTMQLSRWLNNDTFKNVFSERFWDALSPAVLALDHRPFAEAAAAILRLKDLAGQGGAVDYLRLYLLSWKRSGKKPTIRQLKANWKNGGVFPERQVRRAAKEIRLTISSDNTRQFLA